jgi:hypothetical protein
MLRLSLFALLVPAVVLAADPPKSDGGRPRVLMHLSGQTQGVYGGVEWLCDVIQPKAKNPFADSTFTAVVTPPSGKAITVNGFCAAENGSRYYARYMPAEKGKHAVKLTFTENGNPAGEASAEFTVDDTKNRGPVQIDKDRPHHFVYAGSGEHYFWNGTTTYWLLGVQDDAKIAEAIDRLAKLKMNRIRVALNARAKDGGRWFEPQVTNSKDFQFRIDPWPAKNKGSVEDPQFDTSRFNIPMWDKLDKLVAHARSKGVIVSIVFHIDGADIRGRSVQRREEEGRGVRRLQGRGGVLPLRGGPAQWVQQRHVGRRQRVAPVPRREVGESLRRPDP